jgi:uncharacterized membrane protein
MHDLWLWFITVELLGVAALPLTGAAFRHLPDRGWALAKPLALLMVGVAVWLPPMVIPALPYSRGWIMLVVLLFAGGNAAAVVLHPPSGLQWLAWLRGNWLYAALCEVIFAGGMWVMGSLRALSPAAEFTEKFMDQAFLSAIIRASHLPPPDPWLAGHPINYYYFGHFLLANVAKLLDTPAPVAFNVGIALTAGLAALASFGVAANLTAAVLAARRRTASESDAIDMAPIPLGERAAAYLSRAIPYALFTVVAELVLGNLRSVAVWWNGMTLLASMQHTSTLAAAWNWLGHPALWSFDWWPPSRAIPNTITEFPAFSFLLADLHAHVLALPYAIMAVGVALHLWLTPTRRGFALFGEGWGALPTLLASGLTLGALYLINGWDLPTYLALALLALVAHQWRAHGRRPSGAFFLGLAQAPSQGIGIVPGMLDHTAFPLSALNPSDPTAPTHPESRTAIIDELGANGLMILIFGTWLAVLLARRLAASLQAVSGSAPAQPAGGPLSAQHPRGAPNDSYLAFSAAQGAPPPTRESGGPTVTIDALSGDIEPPPGVPPLADPAIKAPVPSPSAAPFSLPVWGQAWFFVGGGLLALVLLTWRLAAWDGWVFVWGIAFMAAALWLALEPLAPAAPAMHDEAEAIGFPLMMVGIGAGLIALCEIVFLRDVFAGSQPRMNTVFKCYFQVWALFALASAPALAWLVAHLPDRLPQMRATIVQPLAWLGRGLWMLGIAALVAASLAYPWGTSHALYPLDARSVTTTLDSLATTPAVSRGQITEGDVTAIRWLSAHATPDAVLAEGIDPQNSEYSVVDARVSVFTGIPAIIGWLGHENQWRVHWVDDPTNAADLNARLGALRTVYTSVDATAVLAMLHRYHVRYVYVGPHEQQLYGATTDLTRFGNYLDPVYDADGVIIYQVPGA